MPPVGASGLLKVWELVWSYFVEARGVLDLPDSVDAPPAPKKPLRPKRYIYNIYCYRFCFFWCFWCFGGGCSCRKLHRTSGRVHRKLLWFTDERSIV